MKTAIKLKELGKVLRKKSRFPRIPRLGKMKELGKVLKAGTAIITIVGIIAALKGEKK